MQRFDTAVIGAGASGLAAAISAGRRGKRVIVCERLPAIGKKLSACGGGRCNLLNDSLDETFYNQDARPLVKSVFGRSGKKEILGFLEGLGLYHYSDNGRVFPVTNQSSTVVKAFELEIKRLGIPVELNFDAAEMQGENKGFAVNSSKGKKIFCENLILAAGGRSYPALGSNGSCYRFCSDFGHRIIDPVPSAVPVETSDKSCHLLQGQKVFVTAQSLIDGKAVSRTEGELLFTRYGLSGTAVLDISQEISMALNRRPRRRAEILVDFVPFMEEAELKAELSARSKRIGDPLDTVCGILPNRFSAAFSELLKTKDPGKISFGLKNRIYAVERTRGWNEAEFTCGGVDTAQVNYATLESRFKKGLYFCGEILDVEGKRGGYNLAWAFGSGFIAGLTGDPT